MARVVVKIRESIPDDPLQAFRASEATRGALLSGAAAFDVDAWLSRSVPPTTEELLDLQDYLLERDQEHLESLRSELNSSGDIDAA